MIPIVLCLLLASLCTVPARAQIELSGMVDVASKWDVATADGPDSQINQAFKGGGPFSLVRSRIFADGAVNDEVSVAATLLYDEAIGSMALEGVYVRFPQVWQSGVDVQVGKMATAFGAFALRAFGVENRLIGTPLIYHYFSAVQGHSVPADNAHQLSRRDATTYRGRGLPIIYDSCWNTGVEVSGLLGHFDYALAATRGALSNPAGGGNDNVQVVGRLGARPSMSLGLGGSFAYGAYLSDGAAAEPDFPAGKSVRDYAQILLGLDVDYSRGYLEVYGELVHNRWQVPNLEEPTLANTGGYLEVAYAVRPGLRLASRYGAIVYDEIADGAGGQAPWDYDVRRLESGVVYYLDRNARIKGVLQLNFRDGRGDDEDHMVGLQLATLF